MDLSKSNGKNALINADILIRISFIIHIYNISYLSLIKYIFLSTLSFSSTTRFSLLHCPSTSIFIRFHLHSHIESDIKNLRQQSLVTTTDLLEPKHVAIILINYHGEWYGGNRSITPGLVHNKNQSYC